MRRYLTYHRGAQALPTMALFAVMIFAMIGFAIDGGLLYVQHRMMQNTADAACLAAANRLALSESAASANTAAEQIVQTNLGTTPGAGISAPGTLAYTIVSDIYSPKAGTGTGLTKGIDISGSDVRVALQSPASAFFLRVVGIDNYTVSGRAHCDAKAGGGGTPFAVARWRGYESTADDVNDVTTGALTTDETLPQYYSKGSKSEPMIVRDLLATVSKSIICQSASSCSNWPGWGAYDYPGTPASGSGLYSSPATAASPGTPGPETYIAGGDAKPNVGDSSFSGPIVLDFRQTTFPSPLFYNGLTPSTALNTYKDFASKYILGTYPGPLVIPGQQIGFYNGVSAGQMIKPFNQRYDKDQIISALVYNGTVNSDPNFTVTFPSPADASDSRPGSTFTSTLPGCSVPAGEAFDGKALDQTQRNPDAKYKINVDPQTYSTFKLRAFISADDPDKWKGSWNGGGDLDFNINGSAPVISINTSGQNATFNAHPTRKFSCTDPLLGTTTSYPSRQNGAQTIYLEAQDTATGKRRAVYAFLDQGAEADDFYAYFSDVPIMYQPLEPGKSTSAVLKINKAGNGSSIDIGSGGSKAQVGTITWYDPSDLNSVQASGTSFQGVSVDVSKQGSSNQLSIDTSNSAATGEEYYIKIPITYSGHTHYVWYYISVRPPLSNAAGIGQFVYALGYANFKITEIGSNYIKGRAVSGLLRAPSEIVAGFQPRLVAWE